MLNWRLINEAIRLVVEYFESEGIMETTSTIEQRAIWWYNYSEIVDAEMLAAVVITDDRTMNWEDMVAEKEFYFPQCA